MQFIALSHCWSTSFQYEDNGVSAGIKKSLMLSQVFELQLSIYEICIDYMVTSVNIFNILWFKIVTACSTQTH